MGKSAFKKSCLQFLVPFHVVVWTYTFSSLRDLDVILQHHIYFEYIFLSCNIIIMMRHFISKYVCKKGYISIQHKNVEMCIQVEFE